jgi:CspA family cold shock protein
MEILNGRVNWYNKKKGYGFITCLSEGDFLNKDIFVHYTNIKTENYKNLFSGEYVSFTLDKNNDKDACLNVTGFNGGKLLTDNEEYLYKAIKKR